MIQDGLEYRVVEKTPIDVNADTNEPKYYLIKLKYPVGKKKETKENKINNNWLVGLNESQYSTYTTDGA